MEAQEADEAMHDVMKRRVILKIGKRRQHVF